MTFSIVASNPSTKELCVATSTGLVAVGNLVPSILPNVGAICVQAMMKPSYRETILDLMKKDSSNESAINHVLKNDKKKEHRQIIVVNAKGQCYIFSGQKTIAISDSCRGDYFSIAADIQPRLSPPAFSPAINVNKSRLGKKTFELFRNVVFIEEITEVEASMLPAIEK